MFELLTEQFTRAFEKISENAVKAYEEKLPILTEYVNKKLTEKSEYRKLIGPNPVEVMESNHENHGRFMVTMFRIKSAESFFKTVFWVYSSYISRGFSSDYFPVELTAWKEGVKLYLAPSITDGINDFYELMIKNHEVFLSHSKEIDYKPVDEKYKVQFDEYFDALIEGSTDKALAVARKYIRSHSHISDFWLNVVEPVMYKIGKYWSEGEITVGQEHLASSITQRIMVIFYPMILEVPRTGPSVLITTLAGEFHKIGSQIVSDLLELNGWNVYYMGANTPDESIISFLKDKKINYAGISTTMIYNLRGVEGLIGRIRKECPQKVNIVLGGQAYNHTEGLWKKLGADGFGTDAREAVELFNRFLVVNSEA